jgi:hypothetical protein
MKELFNEFSLKGMKIHEKLRVWWFSLTIASISIVDTLNWWQVIIWTAHFVIAAAAVSKVRFLKDNEKEEI